MDTFPFEKHDLQSIPIEDIQKALDTNLKEYFQEVSVHIIDCPDLRQSPYNLPSDGIGEYSEIVDLGGVPYLIPLVNRSKIYDLANVIPKYVGQDKFPNGWYISGAGAGPWPAYGTNCEMVISMQVGKDRVIENKSKISLTSSDDTTTMTVKDLRDETRCSLLANLLVSSGKGKVLQIKCKGRKIPSMNFTGSLRESLNKDFGEKPIGLGGLFMVNYSKTKIHVMPDFSTKPLLSDEDVDKWLQFFKVDPPFLCQSVVVSRDPGLDLRLEHSHGWTIHEGSTECGHYHYDVVPEDAEYQAIYAVASKIVRIDRPIDTHGIGRD